MPVVLSYPLWSLHQHNPYVAIVADGLRRLGVDFKRFRPQVPLRSADVLHIHWPEFVLRGRYTRRHPALTALCCRNLVATMARVRRRGGQVVWTVHNLHPHEPPPVHLAGVWNDWYPRIQEGFTRLVCLTQSAAEMVGEVHPTLNGLPTFVAPHPHLRTIYDSYDAPAQTRAAMDVRSDEILVGVIGLVRPYKGVVEFISQFNAVRRPGERLLIAGDCRDVAYRQAVTDACRGQSGILLRLEALSNHDYASLVTACDGLAFNFSSILNSGSLLTALSLDARVLAPALGAVSDIGPQVGPEWCTLFEPPLGAAALRGWLDQLATPAPVVRPDLSPNEPQAVARAYHAAFFGDP